MRFSLATRCWQLRHRCDRLSRIPHLCAARHRPCDCHDVPCSLHMLCGCWLVIVSDVVPEFEAAGCRAVGRRQRVIDGGLVTRSSRTRPLTHPLARQLTRPTNPLARSRRQVLRPSQEDGAPAHKRRQGRVEHDGPHIVPGSAQGWHPAHRTAPSTSGLAAFHLSLSSNPPRTRHMLCSSWWCPCAPHADWCLLFHSQSERCARITSSGRRHGLGDGDEPESGRDADPTCAARTVTATSFEPAFLRSLPPTPLSPRRTVWPVFRADRCTFHGGVAKMGLQDEVDGAARVLHPVLAAYRTDRTEYFSGVFLKDYKVTTW